VFLPTPEDTRSKARICSRSLVGTAGSNPAGSMDVCCECCVLSGRGFCVGMLSRGILPSVVRLSTIVKPRQFGGPGPLVAVEPWEGGLFLFSIIYVNGMC